MGSAACGGRGPASDFHWDELCVFDPRRVRVRYLIEFSAIGDVARGGRARPAPQRPLSAPKPALSLSKYGAAGKRNAAAALALKTAPQANTANNRDGGDDDAAAAGVDLELLTAPPPAPPASPLTPTGLRLHTNLIDLGTSSSLLVSLSNPTNAATSAAVSLDLPKNAAVTAMTAWSDCSRVVARVEEKGKARRVFKEAVARGEGAYGLETGDTGKVEVAVGKILAGGGVVLKCAVVVVVGVVVV
jgi:hypothetical protein